MAKKSAWDKLKNKKDALKKEFNLIENLLVFCAVEKAEGQGEGVSFRIGASPEDKGICVLFEIDRRKDPLIKEPGRPRPDYLAFYVSRRICICTIIELKSGTNLKEILEGIEQIRGFRDLLRREAEEHLPGLKMSFQGILLGPHVAQVPAPRIEKEKKNGLVILPLQNNRKFELFDYVSEQKKQTEKYDPYQKMLPVRKDHSSRKQIEIILTEQALPERILDSFHASNFHHRKKGRGVYINFALSEKNEHAYAALKVDDETAIIAVKDDVGDCLDAMRKEMDEIGILNHRKCRFELIT